MRRNAEIVQISSRWDCHERVVLSGRSVARHPVLAFMLISLGIGFVTAAIPPIAGSDIPPFDQPLHGIVGGSLGVDLAVFLARRQRRIRRQQRRLDDPRTQQEDL